MLLKRIGNVVMVGCVLSGPAIAQTTAPDPVRDRIRALAQAVPFEAVNASPREDIIAHIGGMGQRNTDGSAFAVPDLDLELIMSSGSGSDVLMDPRILDAISRMPAERAAQVLRLIEDRRNGVTPLQDIPSLSGRDAQGGEREPQTLALRGWALDRDPSGAPFIQNGADTTSRIMIVPSMILGDLGRVLSVQDDETAFRVTLESGDVLEGPLLIANSGEETEDEASASASTEAAAPAEVALPTSSAPTRSLRPLPRPEGLGATRAADPLPVAAPIIEVTPKTAAARSIRPRPRPAELAVAPNPALEEEKEDAS
ncbi:hypothetical protein IQ03_01214 [Gemmobacter caeni]|uniref:Uncharacterized protein n=2 Tax=Gemmobacter caeni TaxID=589035 RepID=A0A2T6B909_9RHOB|nr:hypothetical protein C8N34_102313 [Gemmobacter caeni]TWJ02796.1 hypothetical protein IQ03_01214 [Gemmobacter caeni]